MKENMQKGIVICKKEKVKIVIVIVLKEAMI